MHDTGCFITLTYAPEHLPSDLSLNHKHWQDFAKRLRSEIGPFRFLMCGEYGEKGGRPHYHAIIFGHDFRQDRYIWRETKHPLFRSHTLESAWGKGHCSIGEVNLSTIRYVCGYIRKKIKGKAKTQTGKDGLRPYELYNSETGEIHEVTPEYAQMSRMPGLGAAFYEKYGDQIRNHDTVVLDGRELRVPDYYNRITRRDHPERYAELKLKRQQNMQDAGQTEQEVLDRKEAYRQAVIQKSHKAKLQ